MAGRNRAVRVVVTVVVVGPLVVVVPVVPAAVPVILFGGLAGGFGLGILLREALVEVADPDHGVQVFHGGAPVTQA